MVALLIYWPHCRMKRSSLYEIRLAGSVRQQSESHHRPTRSSRRLREMNRDRLNTHRQSVNSISACSPPYTGKPHRCRAWPPDNYYAFFIRAYVFRTWPFELFTLTRVYHLAQRRFRIYMGAIPVLPHIIDNEVPVLLSDIVGRQWLQKSRTRCCTFISCLRGVIFTPSPE